MKIRTVVLTAAVIGAVTHAKQSDAKEPDEVLIEILRSIVIQQFGTAVVVIENLAQKNIEFNWRGCRVILEGQIVGKNKTPESDIQVKVNPRSLHSKTIKVDLISLGQKDLKKKVDDIVAGRC